jgi:hypothetical protein
LRYLEKKSGKEAYASFLSLKHLPAALAYSRGGHGVAIDPALAVWGDVDCAAFYFARVA